VAILYVTDQCCPQVCVKRCDWLQLVAGPPSGNGVSASLHLVNQDPLLPENVVPEMIKQVDGIMLRNTEISG
jgi:hypothetical protein